MQSLLLRVVSSGEKISVRSEKSETGMLDKRTIVLKELGGDFESTYVVSALGNLASIEFHKGDLVFATLKFQSHEHNGQLYMDIVAKELVKK